VLFREPGPDRRLVEVESIRGFAALYVVLVHTVREPLFHVNRLLAAPISFGVQAVILFFVISGFAIHYSVEVDRQFTVKKYAIARIRRIYPLFLVSLLLTYIASSVVAGRFADPHWSDLVKNLLMQQDVLSPGSMVAPYMHGRPLWSLSYEWAYYIGYLAIILLAPKKYRTAIALSVGLAGVAFMLCFASHYARVAAYGLIWWTGVELCEIHLHGNAKRIAPNLVALGVAAAGFVVWLRLYGVAADAATDGFINAFPIRDILNFATGAAVPLGLIMWSRFNWAGFRWTLQPFAKLGPISYGLYIVHWPIMVTLKPLAASWSPWLWIVVSGSATLAIAYLLEIKFQKWVNAMVPLTRRASPTVAPVTP
jgi:peptidoglycan/LPS O-acetylase OafA/YrhL